MPLPAPTVAGTIAFTKYDEATDDYDVCVVNTDGTGLKTLAGGKGWAQYPRWSPDGDRIVYYQSVANGDPQQVWVMDADGSGKKELTVEAPGDFLARNFWPSWSPDGRRIIFSRMMRFEPVARDALFVMDPDGSGLRNVSPERIPGVNANDYWPAWAEDGRISFYRQSPGDETVLSKFSVKPDGSGLRLLTEQAGSTADGPWWKYELGASPDGKWVVVNDVQADRLVIRGDGGEVTLLEPITAYAEAPVLDAAWSPDGKALVIAGQSEGGLTRLYIINADGSGLSAVPGVDSAREPAWRPE
jgi:Tol biopolymer transport system component